MLSVDAVDLEDVALALEHQTDDDSFWWIDPDTGETGFWLRDTAEESSEELEERGVISIDPMGSAVGFRDMEEFILTVDDGRARDLLQRAITQNRPFRRFKDALLVLPELRDQWFAFHDRIMRRLALEWLVDAGLVDRAEAEIATARTPIVRDEAEL